MRATLSILLILSCVPSARAASPDAADLVQQGIAAYHAGDYQAASRAFHSADVSRPDDPRIAFDIATAEAAGGDVEKASELFRQAALARDPQLAAESHYNLGTLSADQARTAFGKAPEDATPEVRQQGLTLLGQAVAHYRDCLDIDDRHAAARHNLETIRLWIKHMQALWAERDRKKQRDAMNLLEFLAMIEEQQRELRLTVKTLATEPSSPKRRQELSAAHVAQRTLGEEIEPLKEKIVATLQPPSAGGPGAGQNAPARSQSASQPEIDKAIEVLSQLADEAGAAMSKAADRLAGGEPADAVEPQTDAVDKLDQIYLGVVPFAQLIQRAIATQQRLIDKVRPAAEVETNGEAVDVSDPAWDQGLLARWTEILPAKAKQELESIESGGSSPSAAGPSAPSEDPQAMQKELEGLKQSLDKAVELGPKANEAASAAATLLEEKEPKAALPKQEESLKLLKEIADPLPKQSQQQPQQHEDQDNQDTSKDQNQDQQQQNQPQQPQEQMRDLSQQQAEAVMRKVRQRQRERDEMQKQLERFLTQPGTVEKDW